MQELCTVAVMKFTVKCMQVAGCMSCSDLPFLFAAATWREGEETSCAAGLEPCLNHM